MSRSKKNVYTINDITHKKYSPLAFRYLTYMTHYRSRMNFTWQALDAAQTALDKIYEIAASLPKPTGRGGSSKHETSFFDAVNLDLDMPKAVAVMWSLLRSDKSDQDKSETLARMDEIVGLSIWEKAEELLSIPQYVHDMVNQRQKLREERKYQQADMLRTQIEKMGYIMKDTREGIKILRKI